MFYRTQTALKPSKLPPGSNGMVLSAGVWRYLQRARSIPSPPGWWECTARFLSLATLTFDLDIQTLPSEGPDTSSQWIWRKSIQRFPRYLMHKQNENVTDGARNRTLLACGNKPGLQCIKKKTHTKETSIQTIDTLIAKAVFGRGCAPDLTGSLRRSPDLLVVWGRHILFPKTYSLPQNVSPICKQELSYRRESRPLRLSVTGRQTTSIHSVT